MGKIMRRYTKSNNSQVVGPRGVATRARILAALSECLSEKSFHELTPGYVARKVEVSSATFYQYFPSLESAMLDLASALVERFDDTLEAALQSALRTWPCEGHRGLQFKSQFKAVFSTFEDLCVANAPTLAAMTALAAGRSNEFTSALTDVRDIMVDFLLDVAHCPAVSRSSNMLDAEVSALLMFYILPLGVDQKSLHDNLYVKATEVAQNYGGSGIGGEEK